MECSHEQCFLAYVLRKLAVEISLDVFYDLCMFPNSADKQASLQFLPVMLCNVYVLYQHVVNMEFKIGHHG